MGEVEAPPLAPNAELLKASAYQIPHLRPGALLLRPTASGPGIFASVQLCSNARSAPPNCCMHCCMVRHQPVYVRLLVKGCQAVAMVHLRRAVSSRYLKLCRFPLDLILPLHNRGFAHRRAWLAN